MSDTIKRAVKELKNFYSSFEERALLQQINDLEVELKKRNQQLEKIIDHYEDAINASFLCSEENPTLSTLLHKRAEILSDEMEKIRPIKIQKKLMELKREFDYMKLVKQGLEKNGFTKYS